MIVHLLLWAWLIVLAVFTAWSYWSGVSSEWWQAAVYALAPLTAVVSGIGAVHKFGLRSPQGLALFAIVLGIAGWCVGEWLWIYYDLIAHMDPFPSLADVFYLVAYVAFAVGLVMEVKFLCSHIKVSYPAMQYFLFSVIGLLITVLAGYFGIYRAYKPEVDVLENVVAISYGLVDVVLVMFGLVIAVVASELRGGKFAKPWWWLLVGFAAIFIADIGFAIFTPEYEAGIGLSKPLLDTIWIVGYLAFAYGLHLYTWMIHSVQLYLSDQAKER